MSVLDKLKIGERGVAHIVAPSEASSSLVDPRTVHRLSDPTDIVSLAKEVQKADDFVKCIATSKLIVIADQIRHLQNQARKVLEEAKEDAVLHHAACNFKKIPGKMYHLYLRKDGTSYFSIISPEEWGNACPHHFRGSYKLEYDMSWTKSEDIEKRGQDLEEISRLLNSEIPSIGYICDVSRKSGEKDKNDAT
ncbi:uncharacterized protein C1orf50 homolog [Dendronephthya gigantea]|uniref:uncharacterized protein C1orf50 homolog n=1 Tax=Dendronephthya gigantea TaxID=151771 RepID=UPI00106ACA27|nr:uncharacterized protein C1orf50 homolog [Dendronephthya gigantea]